MSGKLDGRDLAKDREGPPLRIEGVIPVIRLKELLDTEPDLRLQIVAPRTQLPGPRSEEQR